jgi:hypothetical protein
MFTDDTVQVFNTQQYHLEIRSANFLRKKIVDGPCWNGKISGCDRNLYAKKKE